MKKIFLFLGLVVLTFTSCSNDDDASQDPFIGSWTWYQYFEDGIEIPLEACEDRDSFIVNADGTFSEEYFFENGEDNCVSDGIEQGLWSNSGNNIYKIIYRQGTQEMEETDVKVIFVDNTFYSEQTFDGVTERVVFIRN